ncbi:MAG: double-strand break repair helicase AddA [Pseudomonadota bacterium]
MVDAATQAQLQAALPNRSTWLTANAGSGKTRVLTQRVARLLLTGVKPQRILCLTYTKAAASEMQNRLFEMLGGWAMMPEDDLRRALAGIGDTTELDRDGLARARTLFARAIETPGGLKIQTIHAFCTAILRRFPLEAGLSPDFNELDERLAKIMQREVVEELAQAGDRGFSALAQNHTSDELSGFIAELLTFRHPLSKPKSWEALCEEFQIDTSLSPADIASNVFLPGTITSLESLQTALSASSKATDQKTAQAIAQVVAREEDQAAQIKLERIFLFAGGKTPGKAKIGTLPTKEVREGLSPLLLDAVNDLMTRVETAREQRLALAAAERTYALHQFAASFLPAYEKRKELGGWLDFDDLILRVQALLTQAEMAPWVLFKLDGGIDHILVDEAQDTSPTQWEIIRTLATEFLAGQGAREDVARSVFVVGDKKQSIYSFQGADPQAFDSTKCYFERMLADAPEPLQELSLKHSFRSSPAILSLVDRVFAQGNHRGLGQASDHIAFKDALPGRVDLLAPFEPVQPETAVWYEALDHIRETDHRRRLAECIASQIEAIIGKEQIPFYDDGVLSARPVRPKDVLILVQRRSDVFNEIIRACKARKIPMAGADQLNVAQELAVKDITALLAFLATPEDDLSLACALKSPLLGWDERDLFELAHNRQGQYLWQALRQRESEYPETLALLRDMLSKADFLRPFELVDRLLTVHGGRRKLVSRLGTECEDAVDAFLAQALVYEQTEVSSLTGFLAWLAVDSLRIKRAIDSSADVVRVMTVHGAKGLESPIVILPDTAKRDLRMTMSVLKAGSTPVWLPNAEGRTPELAALVEERKEKALDERQRLLYVAMTRAESWLIIGAAGKTEGSWYEQIAGACADLPTVLIDGGSRFEPLGWPAPAPQHETRDDKRSISLDLSSPPKPLILRPILPSDLGGAKTLIGTDEDAGALARGIEIHKLLEVLPRVSREEWEETAKGLGTSPDALAQAERILTAPHLAEVFAPSTLAEVDVVGTLPGFGDRPLRGTIDRLLVTNNLVTAIDFKSNSLEPEAAAEVPEGLLRQMGAYAAALEAIYPEKEIQTALLWTNSARLMQLPHSAVMEALQRAAKG